MEGVHCFTFSAGLYVSMWVAWLMQVGNSEMLSVSGSQLDGLMFYIQYTHTHTYMLLFVSGYDPF